MNQLYPGYALGLVLGFLIGIPAHHVAHARVAMALGDKSPRLSGRASLSIKRHIDPLGTLIVPALWTVVWLFALVDVGTRFPPFGWGRAQHFNAHLFRKPKRDQILVALAGPAATLVMAGIAGVVFSVAGTDIRFLGEICIGVATVGVFMTTIELLPLPGRDGGRILARFLSPTAAAKMGELAQYEVLFLLGVYFFRTVVQSMAGFVCAGVAPSIHDAASRLC